MSLMGRQHQFAVGESCHWPAGWRRRRPVDPFDRLSDSFQRHNGRPLRSGNACAVTTTALAQRLTLNDSTQSRTAVQGQDGGCTATAAGDASRNARALTRAKPAEPPRRATGGTACRLAGCMHPGPQSRGTTR